MAKQIIALMYDFDKTLCTEDMQNYEFIPNLGLTPKEFWGLTNEVSTKYKMDKILAYMYVMKEECAKRGIKLTKKYLNSLGKSIKYFNGVSTWFERINNFGASLGVEIEHYIISSGTKEIIEGSQIAKYFKNIYGCEFLYGENEEALWPKVAINFTNKTQFIFRISKGTLDISDDEKLNSDTPDKNRHVFYRNMIYIGDGMTDIPCMQVVKDKGGKSVAVYKKEEMSKVLKFTNLPLKNNIKRANKNITKVLYVIIELSFHSIFYL